MTAAPDDAIIVLRRADLRQLLSEELQALRAQLVADLAPLPTQHAQERLLTAPEVAKVCGLSLRSFYRLLKRHPALQALQQGKAWPELRTKAAVSALR